MSGLKYLEDSTRIGNRDCIKLVPRTIETNYVRIYSGSGCSSSVGKQVALGPQNLSLGPGCLVNAIVAHEFLHALGFWHEQSRPDRDEHVTVMYDNIEEGRLFYIKKHTRLDLNVCLKKAVSIISTNMKQIK